MNLALKWKCSNQIVSEHFHWSSTLQEREMLEFLVRKSWLWIELAHFRKKEKILKYEQQKKEDNSFNIQLKGQRWGGRREQIIKRARWEKGKTREKRKTREKYDEEDEY